jgi:hypothetical protein
MKYEMQVPQIVKRSANTIAVVLLLCCLASVCSAGADIVFSYTRWQKRIAYINYQKKIGNLNVEISSEIPITDKHNPAYWQLDIGKYRSGWPNTYVAAFYGLESIKLSDNAAKWDPLW